MADFTVIPGRSVRLRSLGKNEAWLEAQLKASPDLLGPEFSGAEVLATQRTTSGGGRLDLLLYNAEQDRRYVVELMLGELDESHLVRTIEYWDIERRRYPAYDHVAVIVAEDITSRYLNVISLMAGNIPIVALQMTITTLEDKAILHFIKVLDLRELRRDDVAEQNPGGSDPETWKTKSSPEVLRDVDKLFAVLKKHVSGAELSYLRQYLGIRIDGVAKNLVTLYPKKKYFDVIFWRLPNLDLWLEKFVAAEASCGVHQSRALWVRLLPGEVATFEGLLEEAIQASIDR